MAVVCAKAGNQIRVPAQVSFEHSLIVNHHVTWVYTEFHLTILGVSKKRQHLIFMNIGFVFQKKRRLADFGLWDLRKIVIVFYRLNYPNKQRALNKAL